MWFYQLARIEAGEKQVCPFDADGKLLVFSEPVTGEKEGKSLVVGKTKLTVGQKFGGPPGVEIPGGYECNGKKVPAKHIVGVNLQLDHN